MQPTNTRPAALLVAALFVAGVLAALSTGGGARALSPPPPAPTARVDVEADPLASTRALLASLPEAHDSARVADLAAIAERSGGEPRPSRSGARTALLVWPARGAMTGWWLEQRGSRAHRGIDIDGETGDPIWSAGPGTVVHAGPAPAGYSGYGLLVVVDHGGGQTVYAHLSRIDVAVGDRVDAFSGLGAMGTTGNVTGSHLHFELRVGGQPVDPTPYLPPR
jgi:murein DD-endopeptidase MepM/ murein hydrolase activator NlpD